MKREELKTLYEDYLRHHPEEAYVRNVAPKLEKDECIESAHLRNNSEIKETLPKFLKREQVDELNGRYHNELKWELIESDVTDEQITAYEKKNGVTLPEQFREFLQGYSFLAGPFYPECKTSEDYCWECWGRYDKKTEEIIDFTDEDYESEEELIGNACVNLFGLFNPYEIQKSYECYEKIGMIWIGTLGSGDPLLLDCDTGTVQGWDHETFIYALERADSFSEFEGECSAGDIWFKDFDSFLEWVFGRTVYDFEKAEEACMEFGQAHDTPKWHSPSETDNIIYL